MSQIKVKRKMSLLVTTVASVFPGQVTLHYRGETETPKPHDLPIQCFTTKKRIKLPAKPELPELPEKPDTPEPPEIPEHDHPEPPEDEFELEEEEPLVKNRACQDVFFKQTMPPITKQQTETTTIRLFDGFLQSVNVTTDSSFPIAGLFVIVQVLSGSTKENSVILHTLIQGTVAQIQSLSWPEIPGRGPSKFQTYALAESLTTPNPGDQVLMTTDNPFAERIRIIQFRLVTSAVAGDRLVFLQFKRSDGVVYFRKACTVTQAESLPRQYVWSDNVEDGITSTVITQRIPKGLLLETETTITTFTVGMDGADQFNEFLITFENSFGGQFQN